jgi:hypothetical protein
VCRAPANGEAREGKCGCNVAVTNPPLKTPHSRGCCNVILSNKESNVLFCATYRCGLPRRLGRTPCQHVLMSSRETNGRNAVVCLAEHHCRVWRTVVGREHTTRSVKSPPLFSVSHAVTSTTPNSPWGSGKKNKSKVERKRDEQKL